MKKMVTVLLVFPLFVCFYVVSKSQFIPQKLALLGREWIGTGLKHTFIFVSSPKIYEFLRMDGTFTLTGWHIPGEMGGVWAQPFKVLNGFSLSFFESGQQWNLANPVAFSHGFVWAKWEYEYPGLRIIREDRPLDSPGLLITIVIENQDAKTKDISIQWELEVNIRPAWRAGFSDAQDFVQFKEGILLACEKGRTIGIAAGANIPPLHTRLNGQIAKLVYNVDLGPHETKKLLFLFVVDHEGGIEGAWQMYKALVHRAEVEALRVQEAFHKKLFAGLVFSCSDPWWTDTFLLAKANVLALRAEPHGLGRYFYAGIPEYVQLFGNDSSYSLPGIAALGLFQEAQEVLELLLRFVSQQSGRVPHEVSTTGRIIHPGYAVEIPLFISACASYFNWTGDLDFARTALPICNKALDFLLDFWDRDKDLYPEGPGMVERPQMGPEKVDVTSYLYKAFLDLAAMAEDLGEKPKAERLRAMAIDLASRFNRDWWIEQEAVFADSLDPQGKPILEGHWVIAVPLEVDIVDKNKAKKVLARLEEGWVSEWGLVHTRDREPTVWTLPTGVLALGAFKYGRNELGVNLLRKIGHTWKEGMLGAFSELIPTGGEVMQLWSGAMFVRGIIEGIFGIEPKAHRHQISLSPCLPKNWKFANLMGLKVGTHTIDLSLEREKEGVRITIAHKGEDALQVSLKALGTSLFLEYVQETQLFIKD